MIQDASGNVKYAQSTRQYHEGNMPDTHCECVIRDRIRDR